MRAAVDRLHAAQLVALAVREVPEARGRDAHGAERQLLEHLGEMGALLVRLSALPDGDVRAAAARRRLVALAVGSANLLAELVNLAFEVGSSAGHAEEKSAAF